MKTRWTSLVQLGVLAVPFAVFGGAWWICEFVYDLNAPFPLMIAAATLVFGLVGFFWWMIALQRKADEIISTFEHPFFGVVKQKRESWDASTSVPNLGSDIAVSSYEGNQPTPNQQEIVDWLSRSMGSIREDLEGCLDDFDRETKSLPPRPRNLVFESLLLDPERPKTLCLGFDIKDADLPWGFSAFFADGKIDEFTDNH